MPKKEKLEKYLKKLKKEAIIRSIIFGLIVAFSVVALFSLIFFIAHTKQVLLTIILGVLSCVGASIAVYNLKYKPSLKMTAKRVDELGLDERIITMVDYLDKDEFIYNKQREDAIEKLDTVSEKSLKTRVSKTALVILGVVMVLGLSSFALPKLNNNSTSDSTSLPSSTENSSSLPNEKPPLDEDDIIEKLLEKLRELIENSAVDRDFKDQLHVIVDQLEDDLKQLETTDEKIDAIGKAREEIQKMIDEELLRMSIGRCLKESELTSELGYAILAAIADENKIEQVGVALDNLKTKLQESENYEEDLNELIESLNFAIETATKEKNQALVEAIIHFRDSLVKDKQVQNKKFVKRLEKDDLDSVFDDAKDEIQKALEKIHEDQNPQQGDSQKELEDLGDKLDQAMQDAQDQLGDLKEKEDSDDKNKGDENDNKGDEVGGQNPPPKFDDGELDSDTIIDGETPYLDKFDEYYEKIVKYLEEHEDLPDEVREAIEQYLEMLKEYKE